MRENSSARSAVGDDAQAREAQAGRYRLWVEDPRAFSTQRVQPIQHNFHHHPLLQLAELGKLARELAATGQCRFIRPDSQQASEFHHDAHDPERRSIDEVFRCIDEPGSWVALYNVETHPAYARLLAEVTACARLLVDPEQPGMFNVGVSSSSPRRRR